MHKSSCYNDDWLNFGMRVRPWPFLITAQNDRDQTGIIGV